MNTRIIILAFGCVVGLGACARVDVHPISPIEMGSPSVKGLRCYMPLPYLLVTVIQDENNKTQYKTDVISLPDTEHPMVADVIPGWGSVHGTFAINDQGILNSVGSEMDSKGPETIAALTGVLTALKSTRAAEANTKPKVYLLRIYMKKGVLKLGNPVEVKLPE